MDVLLAPFQFLLLFLIVRDVDIRLFSVGVAVLLFVNCFLYYFGSPAWYYIRHGINDLLLLTMSFYIFSSYKKVILFTIIVCSLFMNIYEHFSYYQSFIYPYRDVIQWWMVEAIFITLAWKCSWRYNVKFSRNNAQAG